MHEYDIPVIVTVRVRVSDDGTMEAFDALVDPEGGPWAYSDQLNTYEAEGTPEGVYGEYLETVLAKGG